MTRFGVSLTIALVLLGIARAAPVLAAEVRHHDLSVSVDPDNRAISVRDRVSLTGGGIVRFALNPALRIVWATVNGAPVAVGGRSGMWSVDLGPHGDHELTLSYRGRASPIADGARGGGLLAGPEGTVLAAGSSWVPLFGGRALFTYRLEADLPRPHKAVAPGRLLREEDGPSRYAAVFDFPHPTDEISLFAGPWTVTERRHGDIRLRTYLDAATVDLADTYLDAVGEYIDLYSERIGAYPFSAFHVLSGPLPVGWGFPGLTYIGSRVLRLPFVLERSLGHEVLHNWWGNGVYIDHAGGNWAEGLTTYLADHLYAERAGPAKARDMRRQWLRDYAALPAGRDMPLTAFKGKLHDASQVIGYGKAAMLFHMLKGEIGDAAFDDGLRRLWRDHRFAAANWDDVRAAFEAAAKRDLAPFFAQWTTRPGAPRLSLESAEATEDGLTVRLASDGDYALRVPVVVETATAPRRATAVVRGGVADLTLDLDSPPRSIAVDPDFDLFRRLDRSEMPPILRDVTLSGTAALAVPGGDAETLALAGRLADRMLERDVDRVAADRAPPNVPLLIIAVDPEALGGYLDAHGLPGPPEQVAGRGTARVWAGRDAGGRPVVVVAADGGAALAALMRPLPHYGRRGHLAFEGSKAVVKGTLAAPRGPLYRDFAATPR